MNFLDILILIPILYGAYKGFKHGFVIELFTLLAILVGIYVGIHFSDYTANWLKSSLEIDSEYLPVIAFTFTFLIVGAMIFFAGKMIETRVRLFIQAPHLDHRFVLGQRLNPQNHHFAGGEFPEGSVKMVWIHS